MSSYAEWLAEEEEAALRWAQTTAQPQSLVNVANHFRNATEMIGKDDRTTAQPHIAQSTTTPKGEEDDPFYISPEERAQMAQLDQTTAFFAGMEERG